MLSIKIHIYDRKKYSSYEDAQAENQIRSYDADHCDDRLEYGFDGGLLYDTIYAMKTALAMINQADRLGAVLLVNGEIKDRY